MLCRRLTFFKNVGHHRTRLKKEQRSRRHFLKFADAHVSNVFRKGARDAKTGSRLTQVFLRNTLEQKQHVPIQITKVLSKLVGHDSIVPERGHGKTASGQLFEALMNGEHTLSVGSRRGFILPCVVSSDAKRKVTGL